MLVRPVSGDLVSGLPALSQGVRHLHLMQYESERSSLDGCLTRTGTQSPPGRSCLRNRSQVPPDSSSGVEFAVHTAPITFPSGLRDPWAAWRTRLWCGNTCSAPRSGPRLTGLRREVVLGLDLRISCGRRACPVPTDYFPATSRSKRGLPLSGAKVGSIRSQPGER
jgi:hypothetical protein